MSLNLSRLNSVKAKVGSSISTEIARLHDGKNVLRLFSFHHVVTADDVARGVYPPSTKVGSTSEELFFDQKEHLLEGAAPVICSGHHNCSRCRQIQEMVASGSVDEKSSRKMQARSRFYVNAVDVSADSQSGALQVFTMPGSVALAIAQIFQNDDYNPDSLVGLKGRDFVISCDRKAKNPSSMYTVSLRDSEKCSVLTKTSVGQARDLFEIGQRFTNADSAAPSASVEEVSSLSDSDESPAPAPAPELSDSEVKSPHALVNTVVYFSHEGQKLSGKVVSVDHGVFTVETDECLWELSENDFTTSPPKATRSKGKS